KSVVGRQRANRTVDAEPEDAADASEIDRPASIAIERHDRQPKVAPFAVRGESPSPFVEAVDERRRQLDAGPAACDPDSPLGVFDRAVEVEPFEPGFLLKDVRSVPFEAHDAAVPGGGPDAAARV